MKIISATLRRSLHGGFYKNKDFEICGDEIREIFEIPRNIKKIWIEIHDRPAKDRYAFSVEACGGYVCLFSREKKEKEIECHHSTLYWLNRNLAWKKVYYAEFWYEVL